MLITFSCTNCQSRLEIDSAGACSEVQCPHCDTTLTVPNKGPGPGTTIGGFKIEHLLGKGGMGEVYLARQLSMGRKVALKILPPQFSVDDENVRRFTQEVRTAAQLEHPNIVVAYEAGDDGGVHYLAMGYVAGRPLSDLLSGGGVLAEGDALHITRKIGSALGYAWNKHRMLHRDVKPANIMLDEAGEPKLTDMGLAKSLSKAAGMTESGTVVGTPNYMSPEQAEGAGEIDCRSDMYSLGAMLYHMVSGHTPFEADNTMATLRKLATESLPDPREFNSGLSAGCVDMIEIMLARDPDRRHRTWEALIEDVDRVLAGKRPSTARPVAGQSVLARSKPVASPEVSRKKIVLKHAAVDKLHGRRKPPRPVARKASGSKSVVPAVVVTVLAVAAIGAAVVLGRRRPGRKIPPAARRHARRPDAGERPKKRPPVEHTRPRNTPPRRRPVPAARSSADWIDIFDGRTFKGWAWCGNKPTIEDGVLVSSRGTDLFYAADWTAFTLECEVVAEGRDEHLLCLNLGHHEMGRGPNRQRIRLLFHSDGDLHVLAGEELLWKSGSGRFHLRKWTRLKVELAPETLRLHVDGKPVCTADVSAVPVRPGGIYFYSFLRSSARLRNPRVRVSS